jgi:hypothetical protein
MSLLSNPVFGEAAELLIDVINRSKAIDPKTDFIDVDKIWVNPRYRKDLISVIEMSLSFLPGSFAPPKTVLLTPDNLRRPFGLIPAVACVAQNLETYMAVWKEAADFTTGLSKLFGPTEIPLDCFILQDAVGAGGTVLKMAPALRKSAWNVRAHMCLVRTRPLSDRIIQNLKALGATVNSTLDPIPFYYLTQVSPGKPHPTEQT